MVEVMAADVVGEGGLVEVEDGGAAWEAAKVMKSARKCMSC
jgi:hypothetical protein